MLSKKIFFFAELFLSNRPIKINDSPVKVNLGCGLVVAPGWINIDYNIVALLNCKRKHTSRMLYNYLSAVKYSELSVKFERRPNIDDVVFYNRMKNNTFFFRNSLKGIPFQDNSVDYIYSSHMIGFSFSKKESEFIFKEMYRVLKRGGCVRLSLAEDKRKHKTYPKNSYNSDENSFNYNDLCQCLRAADFVQIERSAYLQGDFPDIEKLDDYPPEFDDKYRRFNKNFAGTMYVNIFK